MQAKGKTRRKEKAWLAGEAPLDGLRILASIIADSYRRNQLRRSKGWMKVTERDNDKNVS